MFADCLVGNLSTEAVTAGERSCCSVFAGRIRVEWEVVVDLRLVGLAEPAGVAVER